MIVPATAKDTDVEVRYIACPVGPGRCEMIPMGNAFVRVHGQPGYLLRGKFAFQCRKCYDLICSEKDPMGGSLGTYVEVNIGQMITRSGCDIEVDPRFVYYCSSIKDNPYLSSKIWLRNP